MFFTGCSSGCLSSWRRTSWILQPSLLPAEGETWQLWWVGRGGGCAPGEAARPQRRTGSRSRTPGPLGAGALGSGLVGGGNRVQGSSTGRRRRNSSLWRPKMLEQENQTCRETKNRRPSGGTISQLTCGGLRNHRQLRSDKGNVLEVVTGGSTMWMGSSPTMERHLLRQHLLLSSPPPFDSSLTAWRWKSSRSTTKSASTSCDTCLTCSLWAFFGPYLLPPSWSWRCWESRARSGSGYTAWPCFLCLRLEWPDSCGGFRSISPSSLWSTASYRRWSSPSASERACSSEWMTKNRRRSALDTRSTRSQKISRVSEDELGKGKILHPVVVVSSSWCYFFWLPDVSVDHKVRGGVAETQTGETSGLSSSAPPNLNHFSITVLNAL